MTWHTFAALTNTIPLSYLDDNFELVLNVSDNTQPGSVAYVNYASSVDLGEITMTGVGATNPFQQIAAKKISGTLKGSFAPESGQVNQLIGIQFDMVHKGRTTGTYAQPTEDGSRLRGILGSFVLEDDGAAVGTGSIRGIHMSAVDTTSGSSAIINGACFSCYPQKGSGRQTYISKCLELDSMDSLLVPGEDVSGVTTGIVFGTQSTTAKFGTGIDMLTFCDGFTVQAIKLKTGLTNGKISWENGAYVLNETGYYVTTTNLVINQQANEGIVILMDRYTDTTPNAASAFIACRTNAGANLAVIDINGNIDVQALLLQGVTVTLGANGSGGVGYRALVVPNA